uniref:PPC domain-containing protein n=1 Tax=Leersia perrieri TaxID=77586 RepID=A0A0D9X8Y1_9ORYZ
MERRNQPGEGAGGKDHGGQQQLDCFSDEVESRGDGGEGGVVAAVATKRRRGRPPGSKNKPKPPVVVTREAPPETSLLAAAAMRPHVLEIPGGGDIAGALAGFARRRGIGICVLAGTGAVANVSLRHPSPEIGGGGCAVVVFHGRYDILSISATFLPPSSMSTAAAPALGALAGGDGGLSISLAGPHGQIVGGAVAGPLVAATTVVVVAAAFTAPTFHRLPAGDDDDDDDAPPASVSGSGGGADADEHRRRHLTPLQPHGMSPATTQYASPSSQHEAVWAATAAAASAPRPRPPY